MKIKKKSIVLIFGAISIAALPGCGAADNAPQIHGGSTEMLPKGSLSTLQISSPNGEGEVVVAVSYPKSVESMHAVGSEGQEGNGDDNTHWIVNQKIAFRGSNAQYELNVVWEYSTRNHKLVVAGKSFDLPMERVAIISFDQNLKPSCELKDNTPADIAKVRKDLGSEITDGIRAKARPALPANDR